MQATLDAINIGLTEQLADDLIAARNVLVDQQHQANVNAYMLGNQPALDWRVLLAAVQAVYNNNDVSAVIAGLQSNQIYTAPANSFMFRSNGLARMQVNANRGAEGANFEALDVHPNVNRVIDPIVLAGEADATPYLKIEHVNLGFATASYSMFLNSLPVFSAWGAAPVATSFSIFKTAKDTIQHQANIDILPIFGCCHPIPVATDLTTTDAEKMILALMSVSAASILQNTLGIALIVSRLQHPPANDLAGRTAFVKRRACIQASITKMTPATFSVFNEILQILRLSDSLPNPDPQNNVKHRFAFSNDAVLLSYFVASLNGAINAILQIMAQVLGNLNDNAAALNFLVSTPYMFYYIQSLKGLLIYSISYITVSALLMFSIREQWPNISLDPFLPNFQQLLQQTFSYAIFWQVFQQRVQDTQVLFFAALENVFGANFSGGFGFNAGAGVGDRKKTAVYQLLQVNMPVFIENVQAVTYSVSQARGMGPQYLNLTQKQKEEQYGIFKTDPLVGRKYKKLNLLQNRNIANFLYNCTPYASRTYTIAQLQLQSAARDYVQGVVSRINDSFDGVIVRQGVVFYEMQRFTNEVANRIASLILPSMHEITAYEQIQFVALLINESSTSNILQDKGIFGSGNPAALDYQRNKLLDIPYATFAQLPPAELLKFTPEQIQEYFTKFFQSGEKKIGQVPWSAPPYDPTKVDPKSIDWIQKQYPEVSDERIKQAQTLAQLQGRLTDPTNIQRSQIFESFEKIIRRIDNDPRIVATPSIINNQIALKILQQANKKFLKWSTKGTLFNRTAHTANHLDTQGNQLTNRIVQGQQHFVRDVAFSANNEIYIVFPLYPFGVYFNYKWGSTVNMRTGPLLQFTSYTCLMSLADMSANQVNVVHNGIQGFFIPSNPDLFNDVAKPVCDSITVPSAVNKVQLTKAKILRCSQNIRNRTKWTSSKYLPRLFQMERVIRESTVDPTLAITDNSLIPLTVFKFTGSGVNQSLDLQFQVYYRLAADSEATAMRFSSSVFNASVYSCLGFGSPVEMQVFIKAWSYAFVNHYGSAQLISKIAWLKNSNWERISRKEKNANKRYFKRVLALVDGKRSTNAFQG